MGWLYAPGVGKRFFYALLALALMVSTLQIVAPTPAQGLAGDIGPGVVPQSDTSGLTSFDAEWDTKNQHRLWWNNAAGRWDAVLPAATTAAGGPASTASEWWIATGVIGPLPSSAPTYAVGVNGDSDHRPDAYWDEATSTLYLLFSGGANTQFYRYVYSGGTYTLDTGPVTLGQMASWDSRAVIHKTPNGHLWAAVMTGSGLMVARSTNDGDSWDAPVNLIMPVDHGQAVLSDYNNGGNFLAVAAGENGDGGNETGRLSEYLFYTIGEGAADWNAVTNAQGTLTIDTLPVAEETFSINGTTYTFKDALPAVPDVNVDPPHQVLIVPGNLTATQANVVAAINGGGTPGVDYTISTLPHKSVVMGDFSSNVAVITAKESGAVGNTITLAETMAAATNIFNGALLGVTTAGASPWVREPMDITQVSGFVHADDEMSLVKDSTGNLYIATETQGAGPSDPQVLLYKRTPAGVWSQHTVKFDQVSGAGDRKRPVVAIMDSTIYVMAPNRNLEDISFYSRSLPLPDADSAGGWSGPTPIFNVASEFFRNTIVPRFWTTGTRGLPVLTDNLPDSTVWRTRIGGGTTTGNQPPAVELGDPKTVTISSPANLAPTIYGNDAFGNPVTFLWEKVSGPGTITWGTQAAQTTTAIFSMTGVYVVRLTATESGTNPLSNSDEVQITVNPPAVNQPPVLTVTSPNNGDVFTQGDAITFAATATDPEAGNIADSIGWTSSIDGALGFGGNLLLSTLSVGTHTINVIVSDGQNAVSWPPFTITVNSPGTTPPPSGGTVVRYAGPDRYATAAAISQADFAGGASVVFVATGTNFPDALAGAAVAGKVGAPILLTRPDSLPSSTAAELVRLKPSTIVILGGPAAVSSAVETALQPFASSVVRRSGANRYATAASVSQYGFGSGASVAFLATGTGFADALAGGPAAVKLGGPVLLTDPNGLPAATAAELVRLGVSKVYVLGGPAAVSDAVVAQVDALVPTVQRVSGANRYATAVAISQLAFDASTTRVYTAVGTNFPDALAGGAAAGKLGAPMLLVQTDSVPSVIAAEITRLAPDKVVVLGGTAVISNATQAALLALID